MRSKSRSPRVTLAEVAVEAGVSTTTASLILSGKNAYIDQFNPNTIQRVRGIAEELGYRANLFASSLHAKGSSFFAVVMNRLGSVDADSWHFRAFDGDLLAGVLKGADQAGVYPIVGTAGPDADEAAIRPIDGIMGGGVFGTIVRSPGPVLEQCIRARLDRRHPTVVVFPARLSEWPTNAIDVDNIAVGEIAGRLLSAQDRGKWALIADQAHHESHKHRALGLERAAEQAGVVLERIELPSEADDLTVQGLLVDRWRQDRPDGLFALTLVGSVGALLACVELDCVPGRDMSLVGCDCSLWQRSPLPPITSVDVGWTDTGVAAVRKLLELREAGERTFETILMKPRVVEGGTCPAARDTIV